MAFSEGRQTPSVLESFRDPAAQNFVARKCPPRRGEPDFEWYSEPSDDTDFTEVTILRNGRTALHWRTKMSCKHDIALEANKIIARMKAQFMGKARLAEAYI